MNITTHLRKMRTRLEGQEAQYTLPIVDTLEHTGLVDLNPEIGKMIRITFQNDIRCIETGKKIKKTFGEGLSYEAFLTSPLASPSITRPELSRIHEGIALRDKEWEEEHHNTPHYVYLSRTSDIKVGVTRVANIPSRWIDQGATEAAVIAETPYRQLAGLIEVALKEHLTDKTSWQKMLKNECNDNTSLMVKKEEVFTILGMTYESFFYDNDETVRINFPVLRYPQKVKSLKLDTTPEISGQLLGIKGQYLLLDQDRVINLRAHTGYQVKMETQ